MSRASKRALRRRHDLLAQLGGVLSTARSTRAGWSSRPPLAVAARVATDVHLASSSLPEVDALPPQELAEAATRAGIDLGAATDAEQAALQGFVSALRGTAGERQTLDGLLDGSLPGPAGALAATLETHSAPGVDITFSDAAGRTVSMANVKIAADPAIVVRHFDRYWPDVPIVYAPSDTAARLAGRGYRVVEPGEAIGDLSVPTVVSLGRPTADFDLEIRDALAGVVVDASTPLAELMPWFGFAAVGYRAVRRLASEGSAAGMGRQAAREAVVASAGSVTGHGAAAFASSAVAVPAAILGAWMAQATFAVRGDWAQVRLADEGLREQLSKLRSATAPRR